MTLGSIKIGESLDQVPVLAEERRLDVNCKVAGQSARAAALLAEQGIHSINVLGGMEA